jgi:hypothetical protein
LVKKALDKIGDLLYHYVTMKKVTPAAITRALHARRTHLLATLAFPPDGLPGSLALSHRRCGSPTCHCHTDAQGHPSWTLTFMAAGGKRVVHVPSDAVEAVRLRVDAGNAFKHAVAEVLAINAQVMVLDRQARRRAAVATKATR